MRAGEIEVGVTRKATNLDKAVAVRIERGHPSGGWEATNLHTGRNVRIESGRKLRCRISEEEAGDVAAMVEAVEKGNLTKGVKVPKQKLTKKQRHALRSQARADQEDARVREKRAASPDGMTARERAMAESEPTAPASKAKRVKRSRGRVFAGKGGERAALAKTTDESGRTHLPWMNQATTS